MTTVGIYSSKIYLISFYDSQSDFDAAETNMLLRELIATVREGKIIQYDGKVIGQTVRAEERDYYRRTGRGMFEH